MACAPVVSAQEREEATSSLRRKSALTVGSSALTAAIQITASQIDRGVWRFANTLDRTRESNGSRGALHDAVLSPSDPPNKKQIVNASSTHDSWEGGHPSLIPAHDHTRVKASEHRVVGQAWAAFHGFRISEFGQTRCGERRGTNLESQFGEGYK